MKPYFPADVSLRVEGDLADAQRLFPVARQLLFKALRMQETGGGVPVKLFMPMTDGSLVQVWLHQGLKILYVQPGPRQVVEEAVTLEAINVPTLCPDMLTGFVFPGAVASGLLSEFHPTQVCAATHKIPFEFQAIERLNIKTDFTPSATGQPLYPKPSMYSGAMKRVVQAIYGIGDSKKGSIAVNHYDYHWLCSHGVVKANGVPWLVEVSKARGVLVMPLPVYACTKTKAYAKALDDAGDTETKAVINEFGGLPTGATFPADVSAALNAGTVYRALSAEALAPFYTQPSLFVSKSPFFSACGWAFAETTGEVVNTCYWDSPDSGEDYPFCELWQLKIAFGDVPSAELVMLETGLFNGRYGNGSDNPVLFFPQDDYRDQGLIRPELFGHIPVTKTYNVNSTQLIAPILAFYNIDTLEVVRFRPSSGWRNVNTTLGGYKDTTAIHYYVAHVDPTYVIPPGNHPALPERWKCPEFFEYEYNVWYYPGYETFEAYFNTPGNCEDGRPSWEPTLSAAWYNTVDGGWVMVDEFAARGWGWGTINPVLGNLYDDPNIRRLDFFGPGETPMADGMSAWRSENWKYVYQVLDRPREFYGTSLNMRPDWEVRNEPGTDIYHAPGHTVGIEVRLTPGLLNTDEIEVGLIVPGGIRESYVLMRALRRYEHIPIELGWTYGPNNYPNGRPTERRIYDAIEAVGFVSGVGQVALNNMADLKPGSDYAYIDLLPSGAVASTTTFRYAWWFRDEWRYSNLAFPVMHGSAAAGASKNYVINETVYSYKTRYETQSKFVSNVACGMSAVEPRNATFVGAV